MKLIYQSVTCSTCPPNTAVESSITYNLLHQQVSTNLAQFGSGNLQYGNPTDTSILSATMCTFGKRVSYPNHLLYNWRRRANTKATNPARSIPSRRITKSPKGLSPEKTWNPKIVKPTKGNKKTSRRGVTRRKIQTPINPNCRNCHHHFGGGLSLSATPHLEQLLSPLNSSE